MGSPPTCVASDCISGAPCTSHRQLHPRVTSPWPTVAYWLYNCGVQPASLVRFWACWVLRNSRNTPQGSVLISSKYLYNMYFLHLLNKWLSSPPHFCDETCRQQGLFWVISQEYIMGGGWVEASGSWSSWVTSNSHQGSPDQCMLLLSLPLSTCVA